MTTTAVDAFPPVPAQGRLAPIPAPGQLAPVPAPGHLLLALDCAGSSCSVALGRATDVGAELLGAEGRAMEHGHAAALVPMLQELMAAARQPMQAVDALAVGIGPGGFTGLRIALATARGLGLGLGKPVIGISNFQAAALQAGDVSGGDVIVLLDSRRAEPYAAWLGADLSFRESPRFMDEGALADFVAQARPACITGDALDLWHGPWPATAQRVAAAADAAAILRLATDPAGRFRAVAAPCYLRPPDVTLPQAAAKAG